MKLANGNTSSLIHILTMKCVEGKLRGVLPDLVTINKDGEEVYLNVNQMKKALEDALEKTPQLKCKRLQKLKIKKKMRLLKTSTGDTRTYITICQSYTKSLLLWWLRWIHLV